MKSKGIEQIPMHFVLIFVMLAILGAIIYMLLLRWLDLTGFKYELVTQRNALDLMQLITTNSPIVKRNPDGEPIKLVLDKAQLDSYATNANIGTETPSEQRQKWEACCDFLDFDYELTIHKLKEEGEDIVEDESWTISNLIFDRSSDCYVTGINGIADLPVVIDEDGERDPGVAILRMTRSPAADLSFWLSQALLRAEWKDYWEIFASDCEENDEDDLKICTYEIKIPLDPEVKCVKIDKNNKRVCIYLREDRCTGDPGCKYFSYTNIDSCENNNANLDCSWISEKKGVCKDFVGKSNMLDLSNGNNRMGENCYYILIKIERGKVSVAYPGKDRNNNWC
jgi:hypothetical protein